VNLSFQFLARFVDPFAAITAGFFLLRVALSVPQLLPVSQLLLEYFQAIVSIPQHFLNFDDALLQISIHVPFHFDFLKQLVSALLLELSLALAELFSFGGDGY
jgi:hypothetical protein